MAATSSDGILCAAGNVDDDDITFYCPVLLHTLPLAPHILEGKDEYHFQPSPWELSAPVLTTPGEKRSWLQDTYQVAGPSWLKLGALGGKDDPPCCANGETGSKGVCGSFANRSTLCPGSVQRKRQASCVGLACPLVAAVRHQSHQSHPSPFLEPPTVLTAVAPPPRS